MKRLIAATAAVGLMALAAPAFAASSQVGIGYTNLHANSSDLGSIDLTGSYTADNNLGVEGQAGVGVVKDGRDRELYNASVFGTYTLPVTSQFSIKGRAGWGAIKVHTPAGSDSENGFAGGGGVQWMFDSSNGIRGDYTYQDLDHGHADNWSAGVVHKF